MVVSASKVRMTVYGAEVPEDGMGMVTWYSAQETLSLLYGHDPDPPEPPELGVVPPGTVHTVLWVAPSVRKQNS